MHVYIYTYLHIYKKGGNIDLSYQSFMEEKSKKKALEFDDSVSVRNKGERQLMNGYSCIECQKFYAAASKGIKCLYIYICVMFMFYICF